MLVYSYTFRDILLDVNCCHLPSSLPHSSPQFESCLGLHMCSCIKPGSRDLASSNCLHCLSCLHSKATIYLYLPIEGLKWLHHTEINSHRRPNTHKRNSKENFFSYPEKYARSVENSWQLSFCVFQKNTRRSSTQKPPSGELKHNGELLLAGFAPVSPVMPLARMSLGHQGKTRDFI